MARTIFVSLFSNLNSPSSGRLQTVFQRVEGDKMLITTDFCHRTKKYYSSAELANPQQHCLHVPAYRSNISIGRVWSHLMFAWQLRKFLRSLDKNDVRQIYCSMPTSSSALVCAHFCKRNGIRFIIDVIDIWPDSLLPLTRGRWLFKSLLLPWTWMTHAAYRSADVILAESEQYAGIAKHYNKHAKSIPIYLGIDVDEIERIQNRPSILQKPSGEIWIAYAGSLGKSYDFKNLIDAVSETQDVFGCKLLFIGDGEQRNWIERYAQEKKVNCVITGYVSHEELLQYLFCCDIAVNIFKENTKVVFSYKFNDYVAAQCFVLNSLEGETARMVDDYSIGRNFDFKAHPLNTVLWDVLSYWDRYSTWRENSKKLMREKLDKRNIYAPIKEIFSTDGV